MGVVLFMVFRKSKPKGSSKDFTKDKKDNDMIMTSFLFIIATFIFYMFWAYHSYRFIVPAMPFILVFSGIGIEMLYKKYRTLTVLFLAAGLVLSTLFLLVFSYGAIYNSAYTVSENYGIHVLSKDSAFFCQYQYNIDNMTKDRTDIFNANNTIYVMEEVTHFRTGDAAITRLLWAKDEHRFNDVHFVMDSKDAGYIMVLSDDMWANYSYKADYVLVASEENPALYIYKRK
jgi:hypothetical protein